MEKPKSLLLGVNIDHVATLRQARGTRYPDPVQAAIEAEQAGADGITMHLREDRRHIQERDIEVLNGILQTKMNLEMAATASMADYAQKLKPIDCCLVPEKREELTTEGGLDVSGNLSRIRDVVVQLEEAGIRVSLFIEANESQIEAAVQVGAPVIEIHTGHFADAKSDIEKKEELRRLINGIHYGANLGLQVNAGHGLNYHNVADIAAIPYISELNIGHAIIARALFTGLQNAVYDIKKLMLEARRK